jgi:hypothetical protein
MADVPDPDLGGYDANLRRYMTHEPERPNPAAPIVDFAGRVGRHYADKLGSYLTAPRDAFTGKLQVSDPETGMPTREAMERGQGVAAMAMAGGMPFAPRGAAGMAGGKLVQPAGEALGDILRSLPARRASEDIHEVASAAFKYPMVIGNRTVPTHTLAHGLTGSPSEAARVDDLVKQMSGSKGYISRPIVDDEGNVIEGQHRVAALKKLGVDKVPVTVIKDLAGGYDQDALEKAIRDAGPLHGDQVKGVLHNALETAHEAGSPEAAVSQYEMPAQFRKHFDAAFSEMAKQKSRSTTREK